MEINKELYEKLKILEASNPLGFAYINGRIDALVEPKKFIFNNNLKVKKRYYNI